MVLDLDVNVQNTIVPKEQIIERMWKLNDNRTKTRLKKVKLVSTDMIDLWKTFKGGIPNACDCVRKLRKIKNSCCGGGEG